MASQFLEIDWDNLSVGSNESFFDRVPLSHEPLQRALMKATVEKWNQEVIKCEERRRQSRAVTRKPTATIPPRGKSVPAKPAPIHKKPPSTIPVTPNVLKKRKPIPRAFKQPEQPAFVFKARPAPTSHKPPQHKSCGNLNRLTTSTNLKEVTKDLQKLTVKPVPASAPLLKREPRENKENAPKVTATTSRSSRLEVRSTNTAPKPRVRSNSVPGRSGQRTATIPVTPMVLKRNVSRTRTVSNEQQPQQKGTDYHFKAKPAGVLQRKPFKPKLAANHSTVDGPAPKAFDLGLEERIKERKMFNHRSTDALEKRQKQVEDEKRRIEDQQYAAARKMTNFRATRNPFK